MERTSPESRVPPARDAEAGPHSKSNPESEPIGWLAWLTSDRELRQWLKGLILVGFAAFFVLFFGFMIFSILIDPDSWVMARIQQNFAGTIGIAFAALASLFIVLLLQYTVGHIRLKGLGFEFEGASAPTVLWLFCFLGIVAGMKMLWGA